MKESDHLVTLAQKILGHRSSFVCSWSFAARMVTCERTRRMFGGQNVGKQRFQSLCQRQRLDCLWQLKRQSRNSQIGETGRIWSGHLLVAATKRHIRPVATYWFLGRPGAKQTDGSKSRSMGSHPNPQPCRREVEHPNSDWCEIRDEGHHGDLWSILFQLIDERSGVTDVIKVKSHLGDVGPSVITQNKIGFHHMLANSLADVVAEEAAKRLLPDLNLERNAKKAERIGIGVAKRLALVQADIWAKRGAGDIYELEPLVVAEETRTRSAIGKMVDELARTLSLHLIGQSEHPRHSQSYDVSTEPDCDSAHTQQFSDYLSLFQVGNECDESRHVSAEMQFCDKRGKGRDNSFCHHAKEEDASTLARNANSKLLRVW